MQSAELCAIVEVVPADFAAQNADHRQVRGTMAPFHAQCLFPFHGKIKSMSTVTNKDIRS